MKKKEDVINLLKRYPKIIALIVLLLLSALVMYNPIGFSERTILKLTLLFLVIFIGWPIYNSFTRKEAIIKE